MSVQRIQQYYTKVEKLIQYGGSKNETAIRSAFQSLLEQYCADKNLVLVPELKYSDAAIPDGTLKDALRQVTGATGRAKILLTPLTRKSRKKLKKVIQQPTYSLKIARPPFSFKTVPKQAVSTLRTQTLFMLY